MTVQLSAITSKMVQVFSNTMGDSETLLKAQPYPLRPEPLPVPLEAIDEAVSSSSSSSMATLTTDWMAMRLERTPALPFRHLSLVMGHYTLLEQRSRRSGILCRVAVPFQEPHSCGWFALDLLTKAVDFYEDFFDFVLPVQKVDTWIDVWYDRMERLGWGVLALSSLIGLVSEITPLEVREILALLVAESIRLLYVDACTSPRIYLDYWIAWAMTRYLQYFFVDHCFPGWAIWCRFQTVEFFSSLFKDTTPLSDLTMQQRQHDIPVDPVLRRMLRRKGASLFHLLFRI